MTRKLLELFKPLSYLISALGIVLIWGYFPEGNMKDVVIMTLMFMHTAPLLCSDALIIAKDKFKLICYIYSLIIFLLTKSVVCLLMLNIFQSFNGLYRIGESEANVDRTNM